MEEELRRLAGIIVRAPFTRRTGRELLYCGFGGVAGVAGFLITVVMLALGLGAIIRNTAAAISAVVGMLFVLPLILLPLGTSVQNSVGQFMPMLIAENSLTAVKPQSHTLSPGLGFAVLCGYAALALAAGGWALTRRDA